MKQIKYRIAKLELMKLFAVSFFVILLTAPLAHSQDAAMEKAENIGADELAGTPAEEMVQALSGGGLSAVEDFSDLASDFKENDPEVLSAVQENSAEAKPTQGFDSKALEYLELQGGLSTKAQIDPQSPSVFKLASKFFERVVFKKDVEFEGTPKFEDGMEVSGIPVFDEDTAGYAVIKKGNQSVVVEFDHEYDVPPVVTATLSLEQYDNPELRAAAQDLLLISDVKFIVSKTSKKGFELMMDRVADSDIPFAWHALAVSKPKVHKKKGDTLESAIFPGEGKAIQDFGAVSDPNTKLINPNI